MTTQTYLLLILAAIIALLASLFLYKYKSKSALKNNALFAILRFLSVFLILIVLINPKIKKTSIYNEKPNLLIVTDNSNSIQHLKQENEVIKTVKSYTNNKALQDRFNITNYNFSDDLYSSDSLSFESKQTHISKTLDQLNSIYKNSVSPTVLISDGNQTIGNDYEFTAKSYSNPIYSIIVGDTNAYDDLSIKTLNVNKYAYLKNKFPVEVILLYKGEEPIEKTFSISANGTAIYTKNVSFSKENNSQVLNIELPTSRVGVQTYVASIATLNNEKNTNNNSKNFAIEVIDESTKVAIVSSFPHPDLGLFKKSIETNKQRQADILTPKDAINQLNNYQLVVLYQPNTSFKELYSKVNSGQINTWTVIGTKTDWTFLNKYNLNFNFKETSQNEDYQPELNTGFNAFIVSDIDFKDFPPLQSTFGTTTFKSSFQSILYKTVNGIVTKEPLLATIEDGTKRHAVLFGEHIWKWRAQSFLNSQSFSQFDEFIGKTVQYLASKQRKERLSLDYQSFYDGTENQVLKAQVFNKNYEFDANQSVSILLKNTALNESKTIPLVLNTGYYSVNLIQLKPGDYTFTVSVPNENLSKSGRFKILDYNIETQFFTANSNKLKTISTYKEASYHLLNNYKNNIDLLLKDKRYLPIQKSQTTTEDLIDWYYLLFMIVLLIATEWFLRKYKGLI
tara:strand:- start:4 stop:2037 length:2034 start_codon:yes stop_codon:yes gene_type:complete